MVKQMNQDQFAQTLANKIGTLSEDKQLLLATCVENILNGSTWGFMNKGEEKAYPNADELGNESLFVSRTGVLTGKSVTLVESDLKYALKTLQSVAPELIDQDFINQYVNKAKANEEEFKKFIEKSINGKGYKGYIGIYSINSTPTMTYKKNKHKAFQLPIAKVLNYFAGKPVAVKVGEQWVTGSNLVGTPHDKVLSYLTTSDGETSLVMPIAIRGLKE